MPPANPMMILFHFSDISFRRKKTKAEPNVVQRKISEMPTIVDTIGFMQLV